MIIHYAEDVQWVADVLGCEYYPNDVDAIICYCTSEQLHLLASQQNVPESVMKAVALNRSSTAETLDLVFSKKPTNTITALLLAGNPNATDELLQEIANSVYINARDTALSVLSLRHKALA